MARRVALAGIGLVVLAGCAWDYGRFDPPPPPCDGGACADAASVGAFDPCAMRAGDQRTTGPAQLHTQLHEASPRDDHTYDLRPTTCDAFPSDTAANGNYSFIFGDARPSRHLCVLGGTINSSLPLTDDWTTAELAGPGGLRVAGSDWYVIDGIRITNVPVGLKLEGTGPAYVRNVFVTGIRDLCIDDTLAVPGFIEDSVFDGCNQGLTEASLLNPTPPQVGGDLVLDGVLMRLSPMRNDSTALNAPPGESHGNLFSRWTVGSSPNHLVIHNSIFEIDTPPNATSLPTYPPTAAAPWRIFPDGTTCDNVTLVFLPDTVHGPAAFPPNTITGTSTCTPTVFTGPTSPYAARLRDWQTRHGAVATTR